MTETTEIGILVEDIAATRAYLSSLEAQLAAKLVAAASEAGGDDGPWLAPKAAAAIAGVHTSTILRWAEQHDIGRRKGGRHEISRRRLDRMLARE